MLGQPPEGVPPERLFRSFLSLRPSLPITFRFAGIEHPPLSVSALHANDANEAIDAAAEFFGDARADAVLHGLIARSLRARGQLVFAASADVTELLDLELQSLATECGEALGRISPLYALSDWPAWNEALVNGARHHSNVTALLALGGSERPGTYWGVAERELLDCHWMVWRACKLVCKENRK